MTIVKRTAKKIGDKRAKSAPVVIQTRRGGAAAKTRKVRMAKSDHFVRVKKLLVGKNVSVATAVDLIRGGLPLESILRIQSVFEFDDEIPILKLIGMSQRTYQRRQKEGKPLDALESDRLYRLAKIEARATEVFQDESTAVDWLRTENRSLGDVPINLIDTEAGVDMIERTLTRIEHGVYA